jgi:hypothetical protein
MICLFRDFISTPDLLSFISKYDSHRFNRYVYDRAAEVVVLRQISTLRK